MPVQTLTHTFTNDDSTEVGSLITQMHFASGFEFHGPYYELGAPYEFDSEGNLIEPTFRELSESLGLTYLRYPGGTQTENYFDLRDPNNPDPVGQFNNVGDENTVVPLNEFIGYVNELAATRETGVVIVLPTARYFNFTNGSDRGPIVSAETNDNAETIYKAFIRNFLLGDYTDGSIPEIVAFEIGNEWYQWADPEDATEDFFPWKASDFGDFAAQITLWIDEVLSDLQEVGDLTEQNRPDIWIQTSGSGTSDLDDNDENDNREIFDAFESASAEHLVDVSAADLVDGLVDHYYQPTRQEDPMDLDLSNWVSENRSEAALDAGWRAYDPDLITTEWNVRADRITGQESPNITGFERLPLLLGLFADMMATGVDFASIWTTQALGSSYGTLSQQGEFTLTPTGLLFRMMMDLDGSRLVDPTGSNRVVPSDPVHGFLRDDYAFGDATEDYYFSFTFQRDNQTTVYFASGVEDELEITADVGVFVGEDTHVHGTRLQVASGFNPIDADADGYLSAQHFDITEESAEINFTLNPYELIRLEFTTNEGVVLSGDDQTVVDDKLVGSLHSDTIFGNLGDDTLLGGEGADLLDGGAGADVIWGAQGDDTISGGVGDDRLMGDRGNDRLSGDDGDDLLEGRDGADTLEGGTGHDTILGGNSESDLRDVVYGGSGNDTIRGGYGNDELRGDAGNDMIGGDEGADTIIGGDGNDSLSGQSLGDEIVGGSGNDFLNGGFGHDRLNGGVGEDRFFHLGDAGHGSDWIQDYTEAEGDVLQFGGTATRDQFQVNFAETAGAGTAGVSEAFVIYTPTPTAGSQTLWALVDGHEQDEIHLQLGGVIYDLLA
ncbi:MAG: calcium-binding protein [Thalassovita sp.]